MARLDSDDFTPYLDFVFDCFGVERVIFGADWPFVDGFIESFFIYPNPAKDPVTFTFNLEKNDDVVMTLLDMNGRELGMLDSERKVAGQYELAVDFNKFIAEYGVYFARSSGSEIPK